MKRLAIYVCATDDYDIPTSTLKSDILDAIDDLINKTPGENYIYVTQAEWVKQ